MRAILLAVVVALPVASALAQQASPDKRAPADKLLPLKGVARGNTCAAYGPGFVKLEGSDSCVRIGGAISVEAGGRR